MSCGNQIGIKIKNDLNEQEFTLLIELLRKANKDDIVIYENHQMNTENMLFRSLQSKGYLDANPLKINSYYLLPNLPEELKLLKQMLRSKECIYSDLENVTLKGQVSQDTQFGYHNEEGRIVHISEINPQNNGLKCGCICPKCGDILVARMGEIREHHFAHHNKKDCKGALETALHLFTKEVLERHKRLMLPSLSLSCRVDRNGNGYSVRESRYHTEHNEVLIEDQDLIFDKVELEVPMGDIKPDIVLHKGVNQLLVEVYVTHEVDDTKREKIRNNKLSTLEIDLGSNFEDYYNFNRDKVEEIILNDVKSKEWIYNKRFEIEKEKRLQAIQADYNRRYDQELKEIEKKEEQKRQKINRILKLTDPEYVKGKKDQWDQEISSNIDWVRTSKSLGINLKNIPPFLNKEIPGEEVFQCDRRIWQSVLFNVFVYKWKARGNSEYIQAGKMIKWIKERSRLPVNPDLIYIKDVEDEVKIPSIADVLVAYLRNLEEYGYVSPTDKTAWEVGDVYYWYFKKEKEDLDWGK